MTWIYEVEPTFMELSLQPSIAKIRLIIRIRQTPELITRKLRTAYQLLNMGQSVGVSCRAHEVSPSAYHSCQQLYGGIKPIDSKSLKSLERESNRFNNLLSDAEFDWAMLVELAEGNF